jgi:hypothetical protein
MNKSTSLEQLQNEDNNQNDLVNEILNEINGANSKMEQMQPPQLKKEEPEQKQPREAAQPVPREGVEPDKTDTNVSPMEMNIENMLKDDSTEHFIDKTTDVSNNNKSSVFDMFKKPLVVGLLVALFSLPFVNNVLLKVLPSREFIVNNSTLFTTLLKFLLSALLFFSLERVW